MIYELLISLTLLTAQHDNRYTPKVNVYCAFATPVLNAYSQPKLFCYGILSFQRCAVTAVSANIAEPAPSPQQD